MLILLLNLFTIFNKVVIAFLLWFKKNNSLPNKLLALIVFFPAVTVLSNLLLYLEDYRFDFLVFLNQITAHITPPMIYFYCLMMIGEIKKLERKHLKYFISAVIPIICWFYYLLVYTPEEKTAMLESALDSQDILFQVMNRCIEIQFIAFILLSIYKVAKHKQQVVKVVSDTEKIKVQWISKFIRLILALSFVLAAAGMFFPILVYGLIVVPILSNIFYFYIVYESFSNSVLFTKNEFDAFHKELEVIKVVMEDKKPAENFNKEVLEKDAQKIEQVILTQKPYLNPNLTLPMLAEMTELSLHRVSEVINNRYKQNFFEFINFYRVKHAQELLLDPKSNVYTFESLAEKCGFGSKVTFNRAFKKITGKTPTEFKKEELEKLVDNYH